MDNQIKRIALFLCSLLFVVFTLHAEQTAYEKRCYEIYKKYYTLFADGYTHPLSVSDELAFSISPQLHVFTAAMDAMRWFSQEQIDYYVEQMSAELKKAESLMTPQERAKKAESEALAKMKETSLGCLRLDVQKAMNQWAQKDEFEKTEEYKNRVLLNAKNQYDSVCRAAFPSAQLKATPVKYDADNERYEFKLKYSLPSDYRVHADEFSFYIPLDVNAARTVSQNTENYIIYDCVWGVADMNIMPQSYKIVINDLSYTVNTKVGDLVIKSNELNLTITPQTPLVFNYSDSARQMIEYKEQFLAELPDLQAQAQLEIDSVNHFIESSPYFDKINSYNQKKLLLSPSLQSFSAVDDVQRIAEYRQSLLNRKSVTTLIEEKNNEMLESVWKNNPKGYLEIYLDENPTLKDSLTREYQEYRCYYSDFYYFAEKHFKQTLSPSERDCRSRAWESASFYYINRDEFDADFSLGEEAYRTKLNQQRDLTTKMAQLEKILNSQVKNPAASAPLVGSFIPNTKSASELNLQGANASTNPIIKEIESLYNQFSDFPNRQMKAAELIINSNEKMKKEYDKNGSVFSSMTEFVSAYFSSNYKKILKSQTH